MSLVHAAQTGHLSFGLLWAQHNENRMAVPYLAMLAVALPTHYDTKVVMLVDAVLFIATFGLWLALVSSFCQRRVTLPMVVVCGVVWFSLADWQNALWGFQLAWYLILGALMAMLLLLLNRSPDRAEFTRLVGAVAVAAVASYSSAEGLLLWPVGLVCLAWGWRGSGGRVGVSKRQSGWVLVRSQRPSTSSGTRGTGSAPTSWWTALVWWRTPCSPTLAISSRARVRCSGFMRCSVSSFSSRRGWSPT